MKKISFVTAICVSVCLCARGTTAGEATSQEAYPMLTNSLPASVESVDTKIHRLNQLEQTGSSNSEGNSEIRQLTEEIDKMGIDLTSSNGVHTVTSTKRAELLSALSRLQSGYGHGIEITVNPTPTQKKAIDAIRGARKELTEAGAIPVWDGRKWIDGRRLAINNAGLSPSEVSALVQLNYWEQNYGSLSVPEKMQRILADSGETSAAISSLKKQLEHAGFCVELDKSLGIWKVQTDKPK